MRILLGCPVPVDTVAGPATVAREFIASFRGKGDNVRVATFTSFERSLPLPLRHVVFFVRILPEVAKADAILMLDPASTGPALSLAARIMRTRSVLRIGGDFLWESYVERTGEPILLSQFNQTSHPLSLKERFIRSATAMTLKLSTTVIFTTEWQRHLWQGHYGFDMDAAEVIPPVLPSREPSPATGKIFLSGHRSMRIKNGAVLRAVWKEVEATHPEAVLDIGERSPAEFAAALKDCYAVIVPSISEVSPNVVFEAIHYGKPFIAPRDTGIFDELSSLGKFVDTRNPQEIAQAVIELLNPSEYKAYVERIRDFETSRSWEEVAFAYRRALRPSGI